MSRIRSVNYFLFPIQWETDTDHGVTLMIRGMIIDLDFDGLLLFIWQ